MFTFANKAALFVPESPSHLPQEKETGLFQQCISQFLPINHPLVNSTSGYCLLPLPLLLKCDFGPFVYSIVASIGSLWLFLAVLMGSWEINQAPLYSGYEVLLFRYSRPSFPSSADAAFSKEVCDGSHTLPTSLYLRLHCLGVWAPLIAKGCDRIWMVHGRDVTVCSKGMAQSWWGTWIFGNVLSSPIITGGLAPKGGNRPALGRVLLCPQCLSQPLCFSTALQPPGSLWWTLLDGAGPAGIRWHRPSCGKPSPLCPLASSPCRRGQLKTLK